MKKIITIAIIVAALSFGGFYFYNNMTANAQEGTDAGHGAGPQAGGMPQAMPVITQQINKEPVKVWKSFSGRLTPVDYVEIQPQVSGKITAILFEDGQRVEKDTVLIEIDPRPYEASVKEAEAALKSAENALSLASKEARRAETLIKSSAISKGSYDERINAELVAKANVDSAQATLIRAQINLDYAHVKAPITGRLGRAEITEGNIVDAGASAPILTTIVSDQGIYADFDVDEQTYLSHIRQMAKTKQDETQIPVRIRQAVNDKTYTGHIHTFDNHINPATGTIRARALINNDDGALVPGMFTQIEVGSTITQDLIVVPDKAIGTDQNRKYVYSIENGQVAYKEVTLGNSINGSHVITSGLEGGETIITEGIIKIRPGMPVTPKEPQDAQDQE